MVGNDKCCTMLYWELNNKSWLSAIWDESHLVQWLSYMYMYVTYFRFRLKHIKYKVPHLLKFFYRWTNCVSSAIWSHCVFHFVQCRHATRYSWSRHHVWTVPPPHLPQLLLSPGKQGNSCCVYFVPMHSPCFNMTEGLRNSKSLFVCNSVHPWGFVFQW